MMNKVSSSIVVILVLVFILGCNNKEQLNEEAGSDLNQSFDSSIYFTSENDSTIKTSISQVIWKEGEVELTAEIAKAQGEQANQSNTVISSIYVEGSHGKKEINFEKKPLGIHSVSLSKSDQLAIHVRDHEGSRLMILDLLNGEQVVLNDLNITDNEASSEKIDGYNWSPDGKKVAFGFGDIGSSYLAVYDTESNIFSEVSDKDYRWISLVVWHKDGQGFDFISKLDDAVGSSVLYRYTPKDRSIVKVVDNLTDNEQMILAKYAPVKIE